jgi:fimbrial chaperone protein
MRTPTRTTVLRAFAAIAATTSLMTHAADLTVMPVALELDAKQSRTTVTIINHGTEPAVMQAEAIGWQREGSVDRDTDTHDLIVNPPVFTVQPGATQVVRVGLRNGASPDHESMYRLVLREIPAAGDDAGSQVQGQVRVLVALRVPVYVAPGQVRREQHWAARVDHSGQVFAAVTNTGNVHYKVGLVGLAGDAVDPATPVNGPRSVVMPGEGREVALGVLAAPMDTDKLTLEVHTDRGVQYVPVQVARN